MSVYTYNPGILEAWVGRLEFSFRPVLDTQHPHSSSQPSCCSSSKGCATLFWPLRVLGTHVVQTCSKTKHPTQVLFFNCIYLVCVGLQVVKRTTWNQFSFDSVGPGCKCLLPVEPSLWPPHK